MSGVWVRYVSLLLLFRYFQCQPAHGLFAPLPKVERVGTAGEVHVYMYGNINMIVNNL